MPSPETVDVAAVVLSLAALVTLFRFEIGVLRLLGGAAALGLLWKVLA